MNMNSTDIADQLWGVTDRIIGCGTEKMVVGIFHMGDWSCRCQCLQIYDIPCMINRRKRRGQAYLLSGHMPSSLRSWSKTTCYLDK